MTAPKVTVLMSVYNGAQYIGSAINSILDQTFDDFEFLIIDDGSTDVSAHIIQSYVDPRIRFIQNECNKGLGKTLNEGFQYARGDYVARMDCDDISIQQRLEKQVSFMEAHPDIAVCATWIKTFGRKNEIWRYPLPHNEIVARLLFESVLVHPTIMIRRKTVDVGDLQFDKEFLGAEDYELWVRLSKKYILANIGEVLVRYRIHADHSWAKLAEERRAAADRIRRELLNAFDGNITESERVLHCRISELKDALTHHDIDAAERWLIKLEEINKQKNVYNACALRKAISFQWWLLCNHASHHGLYALRRFYRSSLSHTISPRITKKITFLVKCLMKRKRI